MTHPAAILSSLALLAALWLLHVQAQLIADAHAELRECQIIECEALRVEARLLGHDVDETCTLWRKTPGVWPR